ncbi:MAG: hypothetical protein Q8Q31_02630 [Nanoarchaeota archaeon]|nr:hypothetical protein [Nanoarchaeota archaeon]
MVTRLETLIQGAKSAGNKLASSISKKAKTALSSLALGAALLSPYAIPNANADVVLTMESRNLNNYPKRFWMPNRQTLKIFVYADNTSQTEGTSGVEWELKAPPQFEYVGFRKPDPYVTLSSSEPHTATNDFFNPKPMDSSANYVSSPGQKNCRLTEDVNRLSGTGSTSRPPVENNRGWLGIYYFKIPTDCPYGDYQFEIKNVRAEGADGEPQIAKGTKMTVRVMQDARSLYLSPTDRPAMLINYNNGIPYIHISENSNQLQLEASSNLENWQILKVNDSQNTPGVKPYWNPFDFVDRDAPNHEKRFYRVKSIE